MDLKSRFSTTSKDPFAGSVLFGAGNSPQTSQALSPVMTQTNSGFGISPMQAMDGVSTIRSPYQARRFGTQDSAQKRITGGRSMTKRPPLSSILDDKIDVYSNGSGGNENLYSNSTPAGPLAMERNDYASTDFPSTEDRVSRGATNKDFPLFPSSTLRSEIFGNSNTDVERVNSSFVSPTPVRPPLRSMMDSFSVDRNSTTDRLNEFTPSGARGAVGQQQRGGGGAEGMRSPVLALGPYTPSLDRLEAAWNSWIVVSGFYPSAASRQSVLQLFLQFGDIDDHVLTSGNWLFIKYVSPVHAERAASLHGSFLNSDTLLSVLVLNARLTQHMNLQLSREGALIVSKAVSVLNTSSAAPTSAATLASAVGGERSTFTRERDSADLGGGLRQRVGAGAGASSAGQTEHSGSEESSRLVGEDNGKGNENGNKIHARSIRANSVPELYLQPHRRKNICEKLMEYFFAY